MSECSQVQTCLQLQKQSFTKSSVRVLSRTNMFTVPDTNKVFFIKSHVRVQSNTNMFTVRETNKLFLKSCVRHREQSSTNMFTVTEANTFFCKESHHAYWSCLYREILCYQNLRTSKCKQKMLSCGKITFKFHDMLTDKTARTHDIFLWLSWTNTYRKQ